MDRGSHRDCVAAPDWPGPGKSDLEHILHIPPVFFMRTNPFSSVGRISAEEGNVYYAIPGS